jgi:hypothetical protein
MPQQQVQQLGEEQLLQLHKGQLLQQYKGQVLQQLVEQEPEAQLGATAWVHCILWSHQLEHLQRIIIANGNHDRLSE